MPQRRLALLAKLVVTVALLGYLFSRGSLGDVFFRLRSVSTSVLLFCCVALFMLTLTTAIRWRLILRHLAVARPLAGLWKYTIIASFFNQVLPSGIGGDIFRAWYARSANISL